MNKKLMAIEKIANKYGESILNKTSEVDINEFTKWLDGRINHQVLDEYISFLKETNGFEFNGVIVYSIKNKTDNNIYDANEEWKNEGSFDKFIFFGDNDSTWYCYDLDTKKFCELDKPSGEIMNSYNSFSEMLDSLLDLVL